MRELDFLIDSEHDGKKACDFLRRDKHFSYSAIVKMRHDPNSLFLDGEPIRTIDRLKSGSVLKVFLKEPEGTEEANPHLDVPVVYEDDDIIIFDKPARIPVHISKGHLFDTLANFYAARCSNSKFRAVGRLDMNTSGLVIAAKNAYAASVLTDEHFEKRYIAVIEGIPEKTEDIIDAPIDDKDPEAWKRFVAADGRPAVTGYKILCSNGELSEAEVFPQTGRTHQIRVHFSYIGCPLAGDSLYGGKTEKIGRHALHRSYICFTHPVTGEKMEFVSAPPEDMRGPIAEIENNNVLERG